jgi:hypothetical protein
MSEVTFVPVFKPPPVEEDKDSPDHVEEDDSEPMDDDDDDGFSDLNDDQNCNPEESDGFDDTEEIPLNTSEPKDVSTAFLSYIRKKEEIYLT